jgi:hypothetical protein
MKLIRTVLETASDKIELHECEKCHSRWHHCTSKVAGHTPVEYWQRAKGKGCDDCGEYDGKTSGSTGNPAQRGG